MPADDVHVRLRHCRRILAIVVLGTIVLAGCGRGGHSEEGLFAAGDVRAVADVATTVALAGPSTDAPGDPVAPGVPEPLAPWQVLVAVAKPEVSRLALFDAPNGRPVDVELAPVNPWYFGGELALLVEEGRETDEWVRVAVTTRPNGTTAWIRAADVTFRSHRVHAEIALGERRVRVWDGDELLADEAAVVGAPRTPTPPGRFYVNARIETTNPAGAYGPWILGLSGFSEALDQFDGALPELAIHGTNRPDLLGRARSNGCIRMRNDAIRRLADLVPLGTPVTIVP